MNHQALHFKIAQKSDIPELVQLVNSAYRGESSQKGWTTEAHLLDGQRTDPETLGLQMQIHLPESERSAVILTGRSTAKIPERLMACVFLQNKKEYGYLGMLTVDPLHQDQKWGRLVLQASEDFLRTIWGLDKIRITVISSRKELISWYERRGFIRTGETEEFPYGDNRFGIPKTPDLQFIVLEKTIG
jgi:ribosomal protein S18 acetylase RimI-like enzyme